MGIAHTYIDCQSLGEVEYHGELLPAMTQHCERIQPGEHVEILSFHRIGNMRPVNFVFVRRCEVINVPGTI